MTNDERVQSPTLNTCYVLVCQGRTCKKAGAESVFQAFLAQPVAGVEVIGTSCMGQCGNGPMVRVLPDEIWYCQVNFEEVPAIIARHLRGGQPVIAMLYPKFHSCDRKHS
jgi:(2Fe-2S) ferredoxin